MKKDFRNNSIYHEEIDIDVAKGVAVHLTKDEYVRFVSKLVQATFWLYAKNGYKQGYIDAINNNDL